MKVFLGSLLAFLILLVSTLSVLYIWGFQIDWVLIWKSVGTLFITCTSLFFLWLVVRIFLSREPKPKEVGNRADLIR